MKNILFRFCAEICRSNFDLINMLQPAGLLWKQVTCFINDKHIFDCSTYAENMNFWSSSTCKWSGICIPTGVTETVFCRGRSAFITNIQCNWYSSSSHLVFSVSHFIRRVTGSGATAKKEGNKIRNQSKLFETERKLIAPTKKAITYCLFVSRQNIAYQPTNIGICTIYINMDTDCQR